jgi:hypothetical protein
MTSPSLPSDEARLLASLVTKPASLHVRVRDLHAAGWTLQAIGNAFSPPRRRSTILSWVNRPPSAAILLGFAPVPRPSRSTPVRPRRRTFLTPAQQQELLTLSLLARRYRAGSPPSSASAIANDTLTAVIVLHFAKGVRVADIARAAGVTHRAITRRLEKGTRLP